MSKYKDKRFTDPDGKVWGSKEEYTVANWLEGEGLGGFKLQYSPIQNRKFKTDFAWLPEKVILEVQGLDIGGWGGHNSIPQYVKDCQRMLILIANGWRVCYYAKGVGYGELIENMKKILGR